MRRPGGLVEELKRRKVVRVAVVYAATGFVVLQAADIMLPRLGVPDWAMSLVVVLTVLGFPIALVLAWALEVTPDGIRRTEAAVSAESEAESSAPPLVGKRTLLASSLLVAVGIGLGAGWFLRPGSVAEGPGPATTAELIPGTPQEQQQSIAVLPFQNLSADPEQEFFADGITEDILTRLAGVRGLRVISRTSVMRYKGSELSLPEIAAALDVSHVLEGSVRLAAGRVRITGQLIRAADDAHLWAESFDRDLADIFAVQTEIAGRIVEELEVQLSERDRRVLEHRGTENAVAYEHYLKGRAALNESPSTEEEVVGLYDEAERQFRTALSEDSTFAGAWAGLARVSTASLTLLDPEEAEAVLETAADAARRAIRWAPDLAIGHVQLGRTYQARGLAEAALEQFRLAAELEPDSPETLGALAQIANRQGRLVESVRLLERAVVLEPGDAPLHDILAGTYARLGELDRARAAYREGWERITPHEGRLSCMLASVALQASDLEATREHRDRLLQLEPDSPFAASCALFIALTLREPAEARRLVALQQHYLESRTPALVARAVRVDDAARTEALLEAAERDFQEALPRHWGSDLEYDLGVIRALRGEPGAALAHLERAVDLGWRYHRGLAMDTAWDDVRDDPRFQGLEARIEADLTRMRAELAASRAPR